MYLPFAMNKKLRQDFIEFCLSCYEKGNQAWEMDQQNKVAIHLLWRASICGNFTFSIKSLRQPCNSCNVTLRINLYLMQQAKIRFMPMQHHAFLFWKLASLFAIFYSSSMLIYLALHNFPHSLTWIRCSWYVGVLLGMNDQETVGFDITDVFAIP